MNDQKVHRCIFCNKYYSSKSSLCNHTKKFHINKLILKSDLSLKKSDMGLKKSDESEINLQNYLETSLRFSFSISNFIISLLFNSSNLFLSDSL